MKIFTLCLSDGHGGLEMYALQCLQQYHQAKLAHVAIARRDTFFAKHVTEHERVHYFDKTRCKPLPLSNARQLSRLIDRDKPDVIHLHWGKDLPVAALAKKLSQHKPKLIYSRHMAITHHKHNFYHRWLYKEVDVLLTITQKLRQEAIEKLPLVANKIQTLYLGVEAPPVHTIARQQFFKQHQLDPNLFTLIVLGRIEAAKGQYLAIEAVEKLKQQGFNLQLAIVGQAMTDTYLSTLKQQVRTKQLTENICFIDFIPTPLAVLPCFDALALTTHSETFGLTLIEAMSAGVATIGSNAGGVVEIIDDNKTGLLFESGNSDSLAEKIQLYLEQPEQRQQYALAGQAKAREKFSKQKHFAQLLKIYGEVVK